MATVTVKAEVEVPADPDVFWEAIQRADVVRACVPGCQAFQAMGDDEYEAIVAIDAGPVRGTYRGLVKVVDKSPGGFYVLQARTTDGPAVSAHGRIDLERTTAGARVRVMATADVPMLGPLAALAVSPFARVLITRFLRCIASRCAAATT